MTAVDHETGHHGLAVAPRLVPKLARCLSLAAAPTFTVMAVVSGFSGTDGGMICSAMPGASPLGGMTSMYLLMSAFHAAPWLNRIARP